LRTGESRQPGEAPKQLVRVTEKEGARLKRLLREIGADARVWGVQEPESEVRLAPDRLVEALVPEATALLNRLMAATDTTRLPGAHSRPDLGPVDEPSPAWWQDMLSFEIRQRVRLLSGL
jgi:hypothetical protein